MKKIKRLLSNIGASMFNKSKLSDDYHTIEELYEHRIELWITVCRLLKMQENVVGHMPKGESIVWRSKIHADFTQFPGWFVLGVASTSGTQMTYHLPISRWYDTEFAETLERGHEFDGHTPADVLKRLKKI